MNANCAPKNPAGKTKTRSWTYALRVILLLIVIFSAGTVAAQSREVRVGVYQNEPKIFMDENGNAAGIFIELLDEIAARESWNVIYVQCEWADCLQALEAGNLDLMPDVAYSAERDEKYDFHKTPVIESWSRIYSASSASINSLADLNGKRVAVLEGSIQQTVFGQLMTGFGYQVTLVPADSLERAFEFARDGSADAAIANHLFGDYFYQKYGLLKTTIDFNPVALYYATAEGRNADLLEAMDHYLDLWISEKGSPYYTTLGHWSDAQTVYRVPSYVLWILGGVTGLLLAAMGAATLFRQQVGVRTRHLELAGAELQKSEQRYQTLAKISPVGIFQTDTHGNTTYVNPKWCEISGLVFEDALGGGWLNAVHPEDRERLRRNWQEATELRRPSFSDYRFVRPDGTIAWVMGKAVPELNSENEIIGYVGTITDITERKQAEAALQASERQLSVIYANVSDALFYVAVEPDEQFRFVSVNAAFLTATGLTHEQVIDKLVQEVIPEPAHDLVLGNYKQAARTKKMVAWEEVSVYPSGEKHGEVSMIPILDADGNCIHLIGTVHDITERVNAAKELRRFNTELEVRVTERTEQLSDALLQAQEADRLKSAFLATMSHELRTPLNSIIGFTGVLLQGLAGPLNAEQEKQLGMTRDSARHLLALINDILDISKIEAGQLEVERAPFEMRVAIESAMRLIAPQAQKKGLALVASIAPNIGSVVGDRRRVEQILLNLLSNAIKFTERGEVQLECRVRNGSLETSVRDSGVGIRPEDMEKLFQPFHQLETGLNRRHEGTGLGLAICRNLAGLLGGEIRAESEWDKGSVFTFTLPL